MKRFGLAVFIVLMVLSVTGCGKKSGLEGKVVDGKGKPMANVKIIAKQVQPIKGYEQFEAVTGSDGVFHFKKLFPTSEYVLIPWFDDWSSAPQRTLKYEANKLTARFNKEGWTTEDKMKVQSGPEGQTIMLASPMVIQPCISTVTGKLVDGQKRPMQGIKIVAKQANPTPGYERFEATTSADGSFSFTKLYPDSQYRLIPGWNFKTDGTWTVRTSGEQKVLQTPSFRFILANGVVSDLRTGLQWKAGPDKNVNWNEARSWVRSLNLDGGGWRMPTTDELKTLYKQGAGKRNMTPLLKTTGWDVWSGETKGSSSAWAFHFRDGGGRHWYFRNTPHLPGRAFAVRSRSDG
ncbi:MAG: DUF1566 domain-containing protein [Deltaproteobacteria bacterium]|nr:DUF1566 domain-containing protein [Deltaproteobacteria bacterium]